MTTLDPRAIVIYIGLAYVLSGAIVDGAKWLGGEIKHGGSAIVHVLKKIPHPHRESLNNGVR